VLLRPAAQDAAPARRAHRAVLIGFELTLTHWFYLYIPWFFPFVAFVVLAARRRRVETVPAHDDAERELVPAG
jgi:hypothetical protein